MPCSLPHSDAIDCRLPVADVCWRIVTAQEGSYSCPTSLIACPRKSAILYPASYIFICNIVAVNNRAVGVSCACACCRGRSGHQPPDGGGAIRRRLCRGRGERRGR